MNTQLLVSRTQPRSTGRAARWRHLAAWAALLGPSVAAAQGVGTVTVSPSRSGPSSAGPRVIEPVIPGVLPPPQPAPPPPAFPTVIPIESSGSVPTGPEQSRVINLVPDGTGLLPDRPPGPPVPRPVTEAGKQVQDLVELVQEPEAEINLIAGHTKLVETRRPLTRIAIGNLAIADVELLSDQPNTRLLNLYGRGFGTTTLTLWDAENKPLTFLIRVTLDCRDLQSRIRQTYPGADVYVRQVGPQVILEGRVPDTKTMADVLTLVTTEMSFAVRRYSGIGQGGAGGGGGGAIPGGAGGAPGGAGGAAPGGGMGGAGAGGGFGGGAVGGGGGGQLGVAIINRVHVPGPRQVLLKVKIAELNRDAIRTLGISWFRNQDNSIIASTIGAAAGIAGSATASQATSGLRGRVNPIASTFNSAGSAANGPSSTLFGIFHAGQFSIFIDALRANTMARILAEPNLMTLDGQPAQFISGGLFPYPVPQSSSIPGGTAVVTVQFQQFGTILTFLPQIMANDVIRLDVEPIFSALNKGEGTTINGGVVPAIDQRRARTVVELREGQTLAIAGLLQTTTNAASVRIPGLGDLPIVGPWFSQLSTETVETELVVLVTPVLVAPMEASEVPDSPGDRVLDPNDFEFYFLGRIEGKSGVSFRSTVREMDTLNVMRHFRSENQWVVGPHGYAE